MFHTLAKYRRCVSDLLYHFFFSQNSYSTLHFFSITQHLLYILGVPKVTLPHLSYTIPFLTNFEMVASVLNASDFPPTTSTKWQRNGQDININDTRYIGSTEDLVSPKLVINRVDFENDHAAYYRCIATNSEGSWTSSSTTLYLEGSTYSISDLLFIKSYHVLF